MLSLLFALAFVSKMATSHWMCDLAGSSCDNVGTGQETFPLVELEGNYVTDVIVREHNTEIVCAIACQRINCVAYLYLKDQQCFMAQQKTSTSGMQAVSKFISMQSFTNIALNKPTSTSTPYNEHYMGKMAVDGIVKCPTLPFVTHDQDDWFLVDLKAEYSIKSIHILTRQDTAFYDEFSKCKVLVGNTYNSRSDFSSYTTVATVTESMSSMNVWFIVRPQLKKPYRYVVVENYAKPKVLGFHELEVYV